MDDPFLEVHPPCRELEEFQVFQCRIATHGSRRSSDHVGEPSLSINLMIGSGECVRLNMRAVDRINTGQLHLKGEEYRAEHAVRAVGISARNCPNNFDYNTTSGNEIERPTVGDFVQAIVGKNLHRFRFTFVNGQRFGIYYWVHSVLQAFVSLELVQSRQDQLDDVNDLLNWRYEWDGSRHAMCCIPGIFRPDGPEADAYTDFSVYEWLLYSPDLILTLLASALLSRNSQFTAAVTAILHLRANGQRHTTKNLLMPIASCAARNKRDTAIATDLAEAEKENLEHLMTGLPAHFVLSNRALNLMVTQELPLSQRYLLALAAVIGMAGSDR